MGGWLKAIAIFAAIMMIVLSGGCAPDVVEKPVSVEVPISVPCQVTPPAAPMFDTANVTAKTSFFDQVKALVAADQQHKGYEVALNSAISGCQ